MYVDLCVEIMWGMKHVVFYWKSLITPAMFVIKEKQTVVKTKTIMILTTGTSYPFMDYFKWKFKASVVECKTMLVSFTESGTSFRRKIHKGIVSKITQQCVTFVIKKFPHWNFQTKAPVLYLKHQFHIWVQHCFTRIKPEHWVCYTVYTSEW